MLARRALTRKLLVNQGVHVSAFEFGPCHELEQPLDVRERHVQRPAMPDERQPREMVRAVGAIAIRFPARRRQEARCLAIADGLDINPGVFRPPMRMPASLSATGIVFCLTL
jgi:hypothetical protein